jgi:ABC-type oligopeptide transport system substrate-binding subunit
MSWASDYDEFWGADLFSSKGFGNTGHISDPAIDEAWKKYEAAPSDQESIAIAEDIFERVDEQAYEVPVCSEKITILTSERVKGVMPLTDPAHLPEYWWVEE